MQIFKNLNKKNSLLVIFFISSVILIFNDWFMPGLIAAGDFWPQFSNQAFFYRLLPEAWNSLIGNGLGGNATFLLWNSFFLNLPIYLFGNLLQLPYEWVERVGYLFPLLALGLVSSYLWSRYFFGRNFFLYILCFLIFSLNTYVLMLIDGGQMGIVFAYIVAPIVFISFIKIINGSFAGNTKLFRQSVLAGLALAFQINLDLRISYLTLIAIVLYFIFFMTKEKIRNTPKIIVNTFLVPFSLTFLLHSFWILPLIFFPISPTEQLGNAYSSQQIVQFLSFAKLENAISLLHPHWPENIFGKVGFMKAEFLLLPSLAFSALFFLNQSFKNQNLTRKNILFFACLGLLGAFLAKGANEPFGQLYLWLFDTIPGFVMFRDPTKFYLLIALSYSILIPFSIYSFYLWIKKQNKFSIFQSKSKVFSLNNIFLFLIFCSLLFLIRPVFLDQLDGTFKQNVLPAEYRELNEFLHTQPQFFRTLWTPQLQRFGYYSPNHPAINGIDFFQAKSAQDLIKKLQKPQTEKLLREAGVKYVIVPFDSEGEIFLEDRKYSRKSYEKLKEQIKKISWLKYDLAFGKILVFKVKDPKDHFWFVDNSPMQWKKVSNTHYNIVFDTAVKERRVIFSESYSPYWIMLVNGKKVHSEKFHTYFNSFILPAEASTIDVSFEPQKWVNIGLVISGISLVICLLILVRYR